MNAKVIVTIDDTQRMFNIFVRLVSGDDFLVEKALVDSATSLGWTLLSKNDRGRSTVWWFEPTPETKGSVPKSRLPKILWHTTIASNVESILQTGLEPRVRSQSYSQTSRRYSPRIYF